MRATTLLAALDGLRTPSLEDHRGRHSVKLHGNLVASSPAAHVVIKRIATLSRPFCLASDDIRFKAGCRVAP